MASDPPRQSRRLQGQEPEFGNLSTVTVNGQIWDRRTTMVPNDQGSSTSSDLIDLESTGERSDSWLMQPPQRPRGQGSMQSRTSQSSVRRLELAAKHREVVEKAEAEFLRQKREQERDLARQEKEQRDLARREREQDLELARKQAAEDEEDRQRELQRIAARAERELELQLAREEEDGGSQYLGSDDESSLQLYEPDEPRPISNLTYTIPDPTSSTLLQELKVEPDVKPKMEPDVKPTLHPEVKWKVNANVKPKVEADSPEDAKSERPTEDAGTNIPNISDRATCEGTVLEMTPEVSALAAAMTKALQSIAQGSQPQQTASPMDMGTWMARQTAQKKLSSFSGDPEEWPSFSLEFEEVAARCKWTNGEKMSKLKEALKGEARDQVRSLFCVPDNVDRVMKTLAMCFGRPDQIIRSLISKAKEVPSPREDRPDTIIKFSTAVDNLTTTVGTLKRQSHLSNPQLIQELVEKLPATYRMQWGLLISKRPTEPSLTDFNEKLREWAEAASFISVPTTQKISEEKNRLTDKKSNERKSNQTKSSRTNWRDPVLTATEEKKEKDSCLCCNKNHGIQKCDVFREQSNNQRWAFVNEHQLCFSCLRKSHRVSECQSKRKCGLDGCTSMHHRLLHKKLQPPPEETTEVNGHTEVKLGKKQKIMLKILPVILRGPRGEVCTYALLDDASTVTLVNSEIARKIGAVGQEKPLDIKWIVPGAKNHRSRQVSMSICDIDRQESFRLTDVRTVDDLDLPVQSVNLRELAKKWSYLRKAKASSLRDAKPMILIGQNYPDLILTRGSVEGPPNAPIVSETKLGWVAHGHNSQLKGRLDTDCSFHIFHEENNLDFLHQAVKSTFTTDAFGVKALQNLPKSKADKRAEQIMESTTRKIGSHYETGLLWKRDDVTLPPSYNYALNRLKNVERQLNRNPEVAAQYSKQIQDYISKGYARKLSPEEVKVENSRTWYLAHFGVKNPNKPNKIRMVLDGAARVKGVSLNDELMTGPDLLSPLVSVLVNFRVRKIGFSADIREMFHQVSIRKEDRCAQRFLWRDLDSTRPPDVYEMEVMVFGATCSPSLAQYIKNKNASEHAEEFPTAARAITLKHYVDDYLDSAHNEEEALKLITEVIAVQSRGGFDLRNWMCSSRDVLEKLPADLLSPGGRNLQPKDEMPVERVLGLYWDPNSDNFTFTCNFSKVKEEILHGQKQPTKREVLQLISSIYDPLGFISHFTVKSRILLQQVWRSGIGWDDEISEEAFHKWIFWLRELQRITSVKIPRCYTLLLNGSDSVQLHLFADASEEAFAAVAFLRVSRGEEVDTSLVMAKCRVAPLKPLSMPRLELQAAVMASRLGVTLQEILDIKLDAVYYWSDSMTVLCWLRSDARNYKPFVAHRLGEIDESTKIENWRWVPSKENVADDATRANKDCDLSPGSRWYNGPPFLKLPEAEWPRKEVKSDSHSENDEDEEEEVVCVVDNIELWDTIDSKNFTSWRKLTRVVAWMKRFSHNCSQKYKAQRRMNSCLLPQEVEQAEVALLRLSQHESFKIEVSKLLKGKPIPKRSRIYPLSPYLDDQEKLRIRGRIGRAQELEDAVKTPMILDPKHDVSRLLVLHYHEKFGHSGLELVANELRQKYHILKMRSAVRAARRDCQHCKIYKSTPQPPEMGQLPACRVTRQTRPFMETGVDYFGPIEITVGRHHEKRYGVLFTCMATRAVHLEIAASLSTDSAIMALRRFIARRGCPRKIFSDNGTNFRGAERELREELAKIDQDRITNEMTTIGAEWHFIPPSAPHMGGAWERKVQSVKVALKAILKDRFPKEEILQTVMAEAETTVNSHPLTRVSNDPNDEECLTPNHFLIGNSSGAPVPGIFVEGDLYLRKQWKKAQFLADQFWRRWLKEYLPTLTCRSKWHSTTDQVKVGNLVFIADGNLPRNNWPRGKIIATFPGEDGVVRSVDVRTATGDYRRPVAKICVLDIPPAEDYNRDDPIRTELPPRGVPTKNLKKPEPKEVVARTRVQPPRGVSLRFEPAATNNVGADMRSGNAQEGDGVRRSRRLANRH